MCLPDDQDTTMLSEKNKIADCFIVLETSMFEKFELFHNQQIIFRNNIFNYSRNFRYIMQYAIHNYLCIMNYTESNFFEEEKLISTSFGILSEYIEIL